MPNGHIVSSRNVGILCSVACKLATRYPSCLHVNTLAVKDGSITNTAAPHDWLVAGWTGKKFVEKIVRVNIKEIADGKGGGGGGTNWGPFAASNLT